MLDNLRSLLGLARISVAAVIGSALFVGACLDGTGATPEPLGVPHWPGVVSDPVASSGGALSDLSPSATQGSGSAYVSLAPGTIPGGELAIIRNHTTGGAVTVAMLAGGFDPVPVSADAGDSLVIDVRLAGNNTVSQFMHLVAASKRPVVVRTDPPPRKRDVPLNTVIIVVFSEPIDASTVTSTTIRLLTAGQLVAARLVLSTDGLRAEIRPDAPLAGVTDYALSIAPEVADLTGDGLAQQVEVPFTTESALAPVASVAIDPATLTLAPRETLAFVATPYDSAGGMLVGRAASWASADTAIATVSPDGRVTGVAAGTTTVRVTIEGANATATVNVRELVFASVTAGYDHTCALTTDGVAYCWGYNAMGQLGDGTTAPSRTPVAVAGGLAFAALSPGEVHTCGLTTDGAAYCWGANYSGGLGNGSTTSSPMPVAVGSDIRFVGITTGWSLWGGEHTCALAASGIAYCWGDGRLGQLGNGKGNTDSAAYSGSLLPVRVSGGISFMSLTAGLESTCGLSSAGTAFCWGSSDQLTAAQESGAPSDPCVVSKQPDFYQRCSTQPVAVAPGLSFTALSSRMYTACGLAAGGTVYCWGFVPEGGNPFPRSSSPPVPVPGGLAFASVEVGWNEGYVCGLTVAGAAHCWGNAPTNGGSTWVQNAWVSQPQEIAAAPAFVSLSVGANHACGITADGVVYCWGHNASGQLGNGLSDVFSGVPVRVAGQP